MDHNIRATFIRHLIEETPNAYVVHKSNGKSYYLPIRTEFYNFEHIRNTLRLYELGFKQKTYHNKPVLMEIDNISSFHLINDQILFDMIPVFANINIELSYVVTLCKMANVDEIRYFTNKINFSPDVWVLLLDYKNLDMSFLTEKQNEQAISSVIKLEKIDNHNWCKYDDNCFSLKRKNYVCNYAHPSQVETTLKLIKLGMERYKFICLPPNNQIIELVENNQLNWKHYFYRLKTLEIYEFKKINNHIVLCNPKPYDYEKEIRIMCPVEFMEQCITYLCEKIYESTIYNVFRYGDSEEFYVVKVWKSLF